MPPRLVVLFLSLLLGLQAVTTDLYLPTLPTVREVLGASMGEMQLSLTTLLLSFGISQLVWGPLSDRFGRRPILIAGLTAFDLASLVATWAPTIGWLIGARTVQGLAMGASVMSARAIVRDLYPPVQGATVMSKALTGLGMIACTCAPLGGLLADTVGWRYALLMIGLFGLFTLGMLVWRFEETLPRPNPKALHMGTLLRANLEILRHPSFRAWCALSAGSFLALFTFLASSSFVFTHQLGYSKTAYGLFMLTMSLAYILGTLWCRWMLRRTSVQRTVALAGGLSLAAGVLVTAMAHLGLLQGRLGAWALMVPVYLLMLGHGVHQPCSQSGAVAPFPHKAGTASALNGFLMMLGAFSMGGWLGRHMDEPVFAMAHGMLLWCGFIAFVSWTLVQRHGRMAEAGHAR
jgi:DHA1 family bicyclomycin/chloramphenicol resistance-like MFS transporter